MAVDTITWEGGQQSKVEVRPREEQLRVYDVIDWEPAPETWAVLLRKHQPETGPRLHAPVLYNPSINEQKELL